MNNIQVHNNSVSLINLINDEKITRNTWQIVKQNIFEHNFPKVVNYLGLILFTHYYCYYYYYSSWDKIVGIATMLQDGRPWFDAGRGRDINVIHGVSSGSGSTQPPTQWVPEAVSLKAKRQEREAEHSRPCSAEVKNVGATAPLLPMPSWYSA
jgi:hypothetical protein